MRTKLFGMYKFLKSVFFAACWVGACCTPAMAQAKDEVRDGSTMTVPYLLAGIGVLLVMVLVCMPARRE